MHILVWLTQVRLEVEPYYQQGTSILVLLARPVLFHSAYHFQYRDTTSIHFDMYRNYISIKKNCSNSLFLQQFPGKLLLPPLLHHSAPHWVLQQHSNTLTADSDTTELAMWRGTGRRELHRLTSGLIQLLESRENCEDGAEKSLSGYKLCSTTQSIKVLSNSPLSVHRLTVLPAVCPGPPV